MWLDPQFHEWFYWICNSEPYNSANLPTWWWSHFCTIPIFWKDNIKCFCSHALHFYCWWCRFHRDEVQRRRLPRKGNHEVYLRWRCSRNHSINCLLFHHFFLIGRSVWVCDIPIISLVPSIAISNLYTFKCCFGYILLFEYYESWIGLYFMTGCKLCRIDMFIFEGT
jgi:hypothetical protein